jgi:hypothetical protein
MYGPFVCKHLSIREKAINAAYLFIEFHESGIGARCLKVTCQFLFTCFMYLYGVRIIDIVLNIYEGINTSVWYSYIIDKVPLKNDIRYNILLSVKLTHVYTKFVLYNPATSLASKKTVILCGCDSSHQVHYYCAHGSSVLIEQSYVCVYLFIFAACGLRRW